MCLAGAGFAIPCAAKLAGISLAEGYVLLCMVLYESEEKF